MWITKKKYKEKMQETYNKGFRDGRFLNSIFVTRLSYNAVVGEIYQELKELEKNTWDKDRVERIKKILITGLS